MMPPKKKIKRIDDTFLMGKINCTILNNKFANTQEILQYYNFLRKSKTEVKQSFVVRCPNKVDHSHQNVLPVSYIAALYLNL